MKPIDNSLRKLILKKSLEVVKIKREYTNYHYRELKEIFITDRTLLKYYYKRVLLKHY